MSNDRGYMINPHHEDCPKCGRVMAKDVWLTDKVKDIKSYCPICKLRLDNLNTDTD